MAMRLLSKVGPLPFPVQSLDIYRYPRLSYVMDIKPANFFLNAREDFILIDLEQSGAALYTLAPEAEGSWDVKEATTGSSYHGTADSAEAKLVYEKYNGPDRENIEGIYPNGMSFRAGGMCIPGLWMQQRCSAWVEPRGCCWSRWHRARWRSLTKLLSPEATLKRTSRRIGRVS